MIFFGDPETAGKNKDALNCVEMAIEMQRYVTSHQITNKKLTNPFD